MGNPGERNGLAEGRQQAHLPLCPQLRPTYREWCAVEGYCVLDRARGRLMIPSVEDFKDYCLTQHFHRCPWFDGKRDGAGPANPPYPTPPLRMGRWLSPGARRAREL